MSVQGVSRSQGCELVEQNEPLLVEETVINYETAPESENVEGAGRDRHVSCTSCTAKSEARQKELNLVLTKTNDETRKSVREKRLTPKMQELKEQEYCQRERKFRSAFEKWKIEIRKVRSTLKQQCSESDLCNMMDIF